MRKPSTRKINVPAKAVKADVAKQAAAARATVTTVTTVAPADVATLPASVTAPAAAKPIRGLAATARTIVANATHFGGISDRDTAYIAFYAGIAKRGDGTVTLASLATTGDRPTYVGSNKPHDAGVINRLTKAGLVTPTADGRAFTFTTAAHTHAAYSSAK